MNELVDQFRAIATRAGFGNTYIDTAVKNIYSTEKESLGDIGGDISDYLKTLHADFPEGHTKDQYASHDKWSDVYEGSEWLEPVGLVWVELNCVVVGKW